MSGAPLQARDLAAIVRILSREGVTGIQIIDDKPWFAGVRRGGKWTWVPGATIPIALSQAERHLSALPLVDEGALP